MSLILDALKRAERERRGESGPTPGDLPLSAAAGAGPRRERDWIGAAVIVGALVLCSFLLWDAFRDDRAQPPPAPAPEAQVPPPSKPAIVARAAPPPAPVVRGTEGVASLDDLTDESTLEGPAAATPKPAPPAPAKTAKPATQRSKPVPDRPSTISTTPAPPPAAAEVRKDPEEPAPARTESAAPAPGEPPVPAAQPPEPLPAEAAPPAGAPAAGPAPDEVPPALSQPAPLRKFREMPPDYRADFPELRVEIHVYEKDPQRRFVMVNGRRYREGERLAEGPALIEIVPDGMVLEHRGQTVLYTLGR